MEKYVLPSVRYFIILDVVLTMELIFFSFYFCYHVSDNQFSAIHRKREWIFS